MRIAADDHRACQNACQAIPSRLVGAAFFLPLVGGLGLYLVIRALVRAPGRALAGRFARAGVLKGRTEADVVAAVGQPSARSALTSGYLLQWQATGCHVALQFDAAGVCEGVTHQFGTGAAAPTVPGASTEGWL